MMLDRSVFFTSRCLVVVLTLLLAERAHAQPAFSRVRPLDARAASLVARGCRDSPTFAVLVASLQRSDAIVHVQARQPDPRRATGETRLVVRSGGVRYLRILIDARLDDESAVALLGHELHHAWEIAQAPWVIDEASLVRLYAQIGHIHEPDGARRADSSGAREAGTKVLAELRRSRGMATE
jgi:hypothetical protein